MRRIHKELASADDAVVYNLRGDGQEFTIFGVVQSDRVGKAREIIEAVRQDDPSARKIIELGCSTGDISGYFAQTCDVIGVDVVPGAVAEAKRRYPMGRWLEARVESLTPEHCDILVLCEFLEHVADPILLAREWMPLAKHVVIGHPVVGSGDDPEPGHLWAYDARDFDDWWRIGGHEMVRAYSFAMGPYQMVMGWGNRA